MNSYEEHLKEIEERFEEKLDEIASWIHRLKDDYEADIEQLEIIINEQHIRYEKIIKEMRDALSSK